MELWSALGSIGPKVNFVFLGNIPIKSQNSTLYAASIILKVIDGTSQIETDRIQEGWFWDICYPILYA